MTADDHPHHGGRERDEILAGEYVLGVLSAQARRRVEQRMAGDRSFAVQVERWQADLGAFNEDYGSATPGAHVFARIETRLFGAPPSPDHGGLWNAAGFWRWISLLTSATAVAALVYASGVIQGFSPQGPMVAQLSSSGGALNLLASFDAASGRIRIVPVAAGGPQEKSLELWFVQEGSDPLSLGVFQPDAEGELLIPPALRKKVGVGATLAVTLEPFGGSPTGLPLGPVVASGVVSQL